MNLTEAIQLSDQAERDQDLTRYRALIERSHVYDAADVMLGKQLLKSGVVTLEQFAADNFAHLDAIQKQEAAEEAERHRVAEWHNVMDPLITKRAELARQVNELKALRPMVGAGESLARAKVAACIRGLEFFAAEGPMGREVLLPSPDGRRRELATTFVRSKRDAARANYLRSRGCIAYAHEGLAERWRQDGIGGLTLEEAVKRQVADDLRFVAEHAPAILEARNRTPELSPLDTSNVDAAKAQAIREIEQFDDQLVELAGVSVDEESFMLAAAAASYGQPSPLAHDFATAAGYSPVQRGYVTAWLDPKGVSEIPRDAVIEAELIRRLRPVIGTTVADLAAFAIPQPVPADPLQNSAQGDPPPNLAQGIPVAEVASV